MKTKIPDLRVTLPAVAAIPVLAAALAFACDPGPTMDTRTFELQHIEPDEAMAMIAPYVYEEREGAPGEVTGFRGGITVRESHENLGRIESVLAEYDRPRPGVRLHFQVIEADGFTEDDSRIADVRAALDELFRFDGYRLVTETQIAAMEGTGSGQNFSEGAREFQLRAEVHEIRGSGDRGSVNVSVHFMADGGRGGFVDTSLAVPVGQTVVLGSSKPSDGPTMILTVRPEFVALPDSTG